MEDYKPKNIRERPKTAIIDRKKLYSNFVKKGQFHG